MRIRSTLGLVALAYFAVASSGCEPLCGSWFSSSSDAAASAGPSAGKGGSSGGPVNAPTPADPSVAIRAISEADVVQLDHEQNRIYAMSASGSLAVVDAATPGQLALLGKTTIVGEPFEMYRRGDILLAMANHGLNADGSQRQPLPEGSQPTAPDDTDGALLTAIDVSDPANIHAVGTFAVAGEIADSRIVGNVLYLATYENDTCWSCTSGNRTLVTTFDVSNPAAPHRIDQIAFMSIGVAGGGWATPWKRSITSTPTRLYVGGLGIETYTSQGEGTIEVLDITDPTGKLAHGATITTIGPITSRWQMDETDGVLRVISQRGVARSRNGEGPPAVETFRIDSASSYTRMGKLSLHLPRQEALKTVRFDGTRAYAITFAETDPLFTLDLADPANPLQKGEIQLPGWIYHLEPRGNLLLGLGLDRRDTTGNLNLSLFDVTDLAQPQLLGRQSFGPTDLYTDAMITSGAMAEDQDRIQKAFRSFDDGLVAIPFSSAGAGYGTQTCTGGGIQLFELDATGLTRRALLPVSGHPRRAIRRDSQTMKEIIGVSDSNITSFDLTLTSAASPTADVVIGTCSPRTTGPTGWGEGGWEGNGGSVAIDRTYNGGRCE